MTHIDPFAPGNSDRHPANFRRVPPRGQEQPTPLGQDAMFPWLVLNDEPVAVDNPDAALIGQHRWEEYHQLLGEYGTPEQRDRMLVRTPLLPGEDMPTLAELRQKHAAAAVAPVPIAANDLQAKLDALKAAGL